MKNKGEKEGGPKEIERDGAREGNLERKHHEEIKKRKKTYLHTYMCVRVCMIHLNSVLCLEMATGDFPEEWIDQFVEESV